MGVVEYLFNQEYALERIVHWDIRTSSWIAFAPAWVPFPPSTKSMSILLAYKIVFISL